jgi:hypothetical protein
MTNFKDTVVVKCVHVGRPIGNGFATLSRIYGIPLTALFCGFASGYSSAVNSAF